MKFIDPRSDHYHFVLGLKEMDPFIEAPDDRIGTSIL